MATKNWQEKTTLEQLLAYPNKFNFFQAVRLIERSAQQSEGDFSELGFDRPRSESIRFCAWNTMSFPHSDIHSATPLHSTDNGTQQAFFPIKLQVPIMGLTGVVGVLPQHYTEHVLQCEMLNYQALQAFLDLFNHRTISLFYRAWKKNHFFIGFEQAKLKHNKPDAFTQALYGLWGNAFGATQNQYQIPDEAITFYSGLLNYSPRCASGLKAILSDYFQLPIEIIQCQRDRLYLSEADCTRIVSHNFSDESFNQLGINSVLGNTVWRVDSRFRVLIGPVTYEQLLTLLPTGQMLSAFSEWVRFYVGLEYSFEVQIHLEKSEVPCCQLRQENAFQLGWNTWLKTDKMEYDADDVVLGLN